MKGILILALAITGIANAHELDTEVKLTERQAALSLPQTTVIRVNKQTKQVEVLHLKNRLTAGAKIENAKFEQVAVNTEIAGIKFDSSNELDSASSTSAWRYGYGGGAVVAGRGPRGNAFIAGGRYRGYGGGGYGYGGGGYGYGGGGYGGGYGYNQPYYGYGASYNTSPNYYGYNDSVPYGSYYSVNNGCYAGTASYGCGGNAYYASYRVAGYAYIAQPYYAYATPYYDYTYCGW